MGKWIPSDWTSILRDNLDTLAAGFFLTLLVSPALLEFLIVRPSVTRELAVLGASFLLFAALAARKAHQTGVTVGNTLRFLRRGGRMWELLFLGAWLVFLLAQVILERGVNPHVPLGYFAFFFTVWLVDLHFALTRRQDRQRWILYLLFAVFAFASLRGMFVLAVQPDVARLLSTGSYPEADRHAMHLLGVGGFAFFTGLACVFPVLVLYRMETRYHRIFTVALILILLGMLFAAYTLVILFTGLGLVILVVYGLFRFHGRRLRSLLTLCLVLLLVIALFLGIGRQLDLQQSHLYLIKISDLACTVADRLFDIQLPAYDPGSGFDHLVDQGSSEERLALYGASVRTVLDHPLTGVGSRVNSNDFSEVSAHSSWLDYPAMFGIPAFALWAGFLVLLGRRLHRSRASHTEKAYRMVSFVVYLLYGLVNPVIATSVFPVVLLFFIVGRVELPGEALAIPPVTMKEVEEAYD